VYTSDRHTSARSPYRRSITDDCDYTLITSFATERLRQWQELLRHCVEPVPSADTVIEALMKTRYGNRERGSIRWVDWSWRFRPDDQRPFWSPNQPRPYLHPSESSRRTASPPD
jgi:hypothetical protein